MSRIEPCGKTLDEAIASLRLAAQVAPGLVHGLSMSADRAILLADIYENRRDARALYVEARELAEQQTAAAIAALASAGAWQRAVERHAWPLSLWGWGSVIAVQAWVPAMIYTDVLWDLFRAWWLA